jgi:hypothetical protein
MTPIALFNRVVASLWAIRGAEGEGDYKHLRCSFRFKAYKHTSRVEPGFSGV